MFRTFDCVYFLPFWTPYKQRCHMPRFQLVSKMIDRKKNRSLVGKKSYHITDSLVTVFPIALANNRGMTIKLCQTI